MASKLSVTHSRGTHVVEWVGGAPKILNTSRPIDKLNGSYSRSAHACTHHSMMPESLFLYSTYLTRSLLIFHLLEQLVPIGLEVPKQLNTDRQQRKDARQCKVKAADTMTRVV